jgi:transposase
MARREITMNEIVEVVYQWHQGAGFKAIRRSLGFDRKTIRKYVQLAQQVGVARWQPFPQELELIGRLREVSTSELLRGTPARTCWLRIGSGWRS